MGAMLANAPIAQAEAKDLIFAVAGKEITDELRGDTARRIAERRASTEAQEGLGAFLEKRRPNWSAE
jgi:methylglutaconyl-CoA hydratase